MYLGAGAHAACGRNVFDRAERFRFDSANHNQVRQDCRKTSLVGGGPNFAGRQPAENAVTFHRAVNGRLHMTLIRVLLLRRLYSMGLA